MIDPRTVELIHGRIDGVNSAADDEELDRRLAGDPAARVLADDLGRLAELLEDLPECPPPSGVRAAVRQTLAAQVVAPESASSARHDQPRGNLPAALRYAAVFAAGALLAAAIYEAAGRGSRVTDSDLYGTMSRPATATAHPVTLEGIGGALRLVPEPGRVLVEIDLEAEAPAEIELRGPDQSLRFVGWRLPNEGAVSVHPLPGGASIEGQGRLHGTAVFERRTEGATTLEVTFIQRGVRAGIERLPVPEGTTPAADDSGRDPAIADPTNFSGSRL